MTSRLPEIGRGGVLIVPLNSSTFSPWLRGRSQAKLLGPQQDPYHTAQSGYSGLDSGQGVEAAILRIAIGVPTVRCAATAETIYPAKNHGPLLNADVAVSLASLLEPSGRAGIVFQARTLSVMPLDLKEIFSSRRDYMRSLCRKGSLGFAQEGVLSILLPKPANTRPDFEPMRNASRTFEIGLFTSGKSFQIYNAFIRREAIVALAPTFSSASYKYLLR